MPAFYCLCACYQLVMGRLVHDFLFIFSVPEQDAGICEKHKSVPNIRLVIDLVKRHPIFYFVFVAGKAHLGKPHKKVNQPAVAPSAVFFHKVQRHFKVA